MVRTAKKTKSKKSKSKTAKKAKRNGDNRIRIAKMFSSRQTLTTRDVHKRLNQGKNVVAIGEVRRLVRDMIAGKQLKVKSVENKMFTLQKTGK